MFLANVVASGTKESIGGALLTGLLGYIVVFFGLFLLMIVVIILGKIMMAKKPRKLPRRLRRLLPLPRLRPQLPLRPVPPASSSSMTPPTKRLP